MALEIRIDMERVLSELGIRAKRQSSGEWKAHCPKHFERLGRMDRHPSWSINEDTGMHGCFSCGYSGSIASFVSDVSDMDMWSAFKWLRSLGLETLEVADDEPREEFVDNRAPNADEEFYLFKRPPKAQRLARHLSVESIKYYDVRWNNDGWCVPITRYDGKLLGYQWKSKKRVLNFPEGVSKGETLFGLDRFMHDGSLILVESPLDVLRLYDCGFNGVATFGAQVTQHQLDLLVSFTDTVTIAMDDDIAGRTSARQIYEKLRYVVPEVRFLDYSKTKKRKDTGKRPKDIGDMTDSEIDACVTNARYASEGMDIGLVNKAVEKKNVHRRTS